MSRQQALLPYVFVLALLGPALVLPATAEDLPAAAGDKLNVVVQGETELTRVYIVDKDGNIFVPLIGKVEVKGKFPAQVRDDLAKRLSKIIRSPQVSVDFMERAQISVGFTGMVRKPGAVMLKKGSRLLDGLAAAEGLVIPDADDQNVRLQRRGEATARTLNLRSIDKDAALNLELLDGDSITVPRIPMSSVQVLGAVNKPGEVQRKEKVTLLEAVLAAGGLTTDADTKKVQVLRKNATEPQVVNLNDVLSGTAKNEFLQDGDTVTIPATPKILVRVFGHVAKPLTKPGEIEMRAGTTVLEAITAAGGFGMDADKAAVFLTDAEGDVKRVNLFKLESPDGALPLEDGTRVFVPQATPRRFYVAGGVNEPGAFPFPPDPTQKIYLTDALAQAKGPIDRAKKKTIALVRKNPQGGQPAIHQIDFEALLKKKDVAANMEILVDDVVYVDAEPEGRRDNRSFLEKVLGIAGAFVGF